MEDRLLTAAAIKALNRCTALGLIYPPSSILNSNCMNQEYHGL